MKVNGKKVAASKNWQQPVRRNIAAPLRKGANSIEVDAEMSGGSAGFICQIVVAYGDKQQVLQTGKAWEARKPDGPWQAAAELHAYGAGPWRDG